LSSLWDFIHAFLSCTYLCVGQLGFVIYSPSTSTARIVCRRRRSLSMSCTLVWYTRSCITAPADDIVNRVQFRSVRWPHVRSNKVWSVVTLLLNATVEFSTTVKDLGVVLDSQLTMADHVAALSRSCFLYIRQLRSIRQSLTTDAMKTLVLWCTPFSAVASTTATASSLVSATEAAISPECSCTSGHWSQEIRSYDAYSTQTALATSTPANYFQDGRTGIQMSAWYGSAIPVYGSAIPVDILRANVITRRSVSPALC